MAHDNHDFPLVYGQVDVIQHLDRAIMAGHVFYLDDVGVFGVRAHNRSIRGKREYTKFPGKMAGPGPANYWSFSISGLALMPSPQPAQLR